MLSLIHQIRSHRVGLALSGGGVRGLAHIGVLKALAEHDIKPEVVAGTSVGSLIGAAFAAGKSWEQIAEMARTVFWPSFLNGPRLERFCETHLPENFSALDLPFAAVATIASAQKPLTIVTGHLPSAISASCAIPGIRRAVKREGVKLLDGGVVCVLPARACRELGADYIISSDVWEWSSLLRRVGVAPGSKASRRFYPAHYEMAVSQTKLLINSPLPFAGYLPGRKAVDRMIAAGEVATRRALQRCDPSSEITVQDAEESAVPRP